MQCIVVRKDLPIMPSDLLHDILAIILGFSGVHLGGTTTVVTRINQEAFRVRGVGRRNE